MLYYHSRALRVVLLVVTEVRCHVEQEQSRALGSRAGGGCWADCPAVWARGAAPTRPDLSSGPACSLGAEERLAPESMQTCGGITPLLLLPCGHHSRAGSPDSVDERRPRACHSARLCVRPGRAAPSLCSSASAAPCSGAWPRSH